jgi:hypothetical protein
MSQFETKVLFNGELGFLGPFLFPFSFFFFLFFCLLGTISFRNREAAAKFLEILGEVVEKSVGMAN